MSEILCIKSVCLGKFVFDSVRIFVSFCVYVSCICVDVCMGVCVYICLCVYGFMSVFFYLCMFVHRYMCI